MCHTLPIVELALQGQASDVTETAAAPDIVFGGSAYVGEEHCSEIATHAHERTRSLADVAWRYAATRFPFAARVAWQDSMPLRIDRIELTGRSAGEQIISLATPQKPGLIQLGIPAHSSSAYQASCHLVHRSMQLGLYLREQHGGPVVANGFSYSPWRQRLQPNRLLWLAWWSHAAQYAYLARILTTERWTLAEDPNLLMQAAQERAKLEIAFLSLGQSGCLAESERHACEASRRIIDLATHELSAVPDFNDARHRAAQQASDALEQWLRNHGCA